MKHLYIWLFTAYSAFAFSQGTVYFRYDEAGNQIYRGDSSGDKPAPEKQSATVANLDVSDAAAEKFWSGVEVYPVPVKDLLTVRWNDENNGLIETVALYQHSTMGTAYQKTNSSGLAKQVQIGMSGMYAGAYVLQFTLKDGRIYSKNIIKE